MALYYDPLRGPRRTLDAESDCPCCGDGECTCKRCDTAAGTVGMCLNVSSLTIFPNGDPVFGGPYNCSALLPMVLSPWLRANSVYPYQRTQYAVFQHSALGSPLSVLISITLRGGFHLNGPCNTNTTTAYLVLESMAARCNGTSADGNVDGRSEWFVNNSQLDECGTVTPETPVDWLLDDDYWSSAGEWKFRTCSASDTYMPLCDDGGPMTEGCLSCCDNDWWCDRRPTMPRYLYITCPGFACVPSGGGQYCYPYTPISPGPWLLVPNQQSIDGIHMNWEGLPSWYLGCDGNMYKDYNVWNSTDGFSLLMSQALSSGLPYYKTTTLYPCGAISAVHSCDPMDAELTLTNDIPQCFAPITFVITE